MEEEEDSVIEVEEGDTLRILEITGVAVGEEVTYNHRIPGSIRVEHSRRILE